LVAVTVNTVAAPTAVAQSFCNSGTVANLSASGSGLKWYNVATGGTALATTTALSTGNYYVSQTNATCESTRTLVAVTVNTVAAPTAVAQSFCNSGTVANLSASGTGIKWYNVATGGTALVTTTALATGNYYVSQTNATCESTRTLVAVTVNTVAAPTGNATQSFVTGSTISSLIATGSAILWYSALADALANSNVLATNSTLTNNTTYYAMQTVNGCRSTSALAVTVTVTLSNESFNSNLKFSMYPNPATDILNIVIENDLKSIEIYSLLGQKVMNENSKQINISNLPHGIYNVRIEDVNNAVATQKLIIK
jgi:Secretion system C-terminal sorting domain/Ig-like domain CHU_C associated